MVRRKRKLPIKKGIKRKSTKRRSRKFVSQFPDYCKKCRRTTIFKEGSGGSYACSKCGWIDPNDW